VFEGLLAPWHLVILAVVLLLVLGPQRIAGRWHGIVSSVQRLGEERVDGPDEPDPSQKPSSEAGPRRSFAYRIGRRFRRRSRGRNV